MTTKEKNNIDDSISDILTLTNTESREKEIEWTVDHEKLLIEWGDKAMCYRWLHSKAHADFSNRNTWYTIPVIIISTLTGTANFAQQRVPFQYQNLFVMLVGGFNILAGIITTIQQFLKITQLNEAHRVSTIAWDKFYRNIKIELAKHPKERLEVKQCIKVYKDEFDRLMDTSPIIPEYIIDEFKESFQNSETFKAIVKPEICDVLVSTNDIRNQWYNNENLNKTEDENVLLKKQKENKQKKTQELNSKILEDFVRSFQHLNNRDPMDTEIMDNLKEKIATKTLEKLIELRKVNIVIQPDPA